MFIDFRWVADWIGSRPEGVLIGGGRFGLHVEREDMEGIPGAAFGPFWKAQVILQIPAIAIERSSDPDDPQGEKRKAGVASP